ncbi:MAG: hypothetical protein QW727_00530 [Candidatus Pacearchaeota archaeon]
MGKRGQVTIFVIVALIIVAGILIFFVARGIINTRDTTNQFSPIYESFDLCIKENTKTALKISGSQGGYIELPPFQPGSEFSPFSSQLDFLGNPVPYWYYITSNGLAKEQIPSMNLIERQVEDYLNDELVRCDFSSFRRQGFEITSGVPKASVKIFDEEVKVNLAMDLNVQKENSTSKKSSHEVRIQSKLGKFYNLAKEIYEREKNQAFLENYSRDVLYNYLPITGSEISCAPLVWSANQVVNDLKNGLEANIQAIKIDNGKYNLKDKKSRYFVVPIKSKENVRFFYDKSWPTKVEIWPAENNLLIAEPIGLDEGLGVLGFCFVRYHFIYDVFHPVLVQIYNEDEIFQFPVAVIIEKNVPRKSISEGESVKSTSLDNFCENANTHFKISTFDSNSNPVEADIYFECFNQKCNIGKTSISDSNAFINTRFPQCINGIVSAKAVGYVTGEQIISTNEEGEANIILNKLYTFPLDLVVGGVPFNPTREGIAIITFSSDKYTTSVIYPNQREISLAEGFYNLSVQVFSKSSLEIPSEVTTQCTKIPNKWLFGGTREECFDIQLPSQKIENTLSAGGKSQKFILEEDLRLARRVKIDVDVLPLPVTLEQIQQNYFLIENKGVSVTFL